MLNWNLSTLINKIGLRTEYCIDSYDREKRAKTAGEKFVQIGKMLSGSHVIGLRLSGFSTPTRQLMAFSSEDIRVSEEDYQWIFEKCAKTDPKRKENRACEMKARYFLHCHQKPVESSDDYDYFDKHFCCKCNRYYQFNY